jgi:hypothetical protein
VIRPIRVCANCRNLEVVEEGREFEAIADTAYAVFHCHVLGAQTREDYLMTPVSSELPIERPRECPHWQEYVPA